MNKDQYIVVRGVLFWPKIVGDARPYTGNPKFDKGPYWSVDVTPDEKSRKVIENAGISDKLREPRGEKETRKETFLTLRQLLNKPDGGKNRPPKIRDIRDQPWNGEEIGNGTVADVKIKVKDYGTTIGAYLQEIRILRHIPYEGGGAGFEPLSADDEFFGAATGEVSPAAEPAHNGQDELDDDVPF